MTKGSRPSAAHNSSSTAEARVGPRHTFHLGLQPDKESDLSRIEKIERTRSLAPSVRRGLQEEHAIKDDFWR